MMSGASPTEITEITQLTHRDDRVRWGVIGAGRIALVFCNAIRFSKTGTLHAVASSDATRAHRLAELFGCPRSYHGYDALLDDPEVDAVYIANLNSDHARWAIAAAKAGKHILVEKPIALTRDELTEMTRAAHENRVALVEGFMYRFHPQLDRVRALLRAGAIGEVERIEAAFGYRASGRADDRVYQRAQGGGALWDVGCYTTSAALWVARLVLSADQRDMMRTSLSGSGLIGPSGVDLHAIATLSLSNQVKDQLTAQLTTSITHDLPSRWVIHGAEGQLEILEPWLPSTLCRFASSPLPTTQRFPPSTLALRCQRGGRFIEDRMSIEVDRDLFSYEIDAFAEAIPHAQHPLMPWAESLKNLELLTRWRAEIIGEM